jgi:hypothetical protein
MRLVLIRTCRAERDGWCDNERSRSVRQSNDRYGGDLDELDKGTVDDARDRRSAALLHVDQVA